MALSDIKTNTKKMINQRSTPDKWQLQNQANNNQINGIYTYTPISKIKTIQLKYSRLIQHTKEIKNYIYQLRTKLTKAQTGGKKKKLKQVAMWGIKQ